MGKDTGIKERIIARIQKVLENKVAVKENVTNELHSSEEHDDPSVTFVENFIKKNKKLFYCTSEAEIKSVLEHIIRQHTLDNIRCCSSSLTYFFNKLGLNQIKTPVSMEECDVCIIPCDGMIASDATLIITDGQDELYLPKKTLILFAFTSKASSTWNEALKKLGDLYDQGLPNKILRINPVETAFQRIYLILSED